MRWTSIALAFLSSLATVSSSLKDCGVGISVFTLHEQGFSPEPPVPGENATLWIYYEVPPGLTITDGAAEYSFKLNGIPFPPTVDPLCTQVECPLSPGLYNLSSTSVWPSGISGKIVSQIAWYDLGDSLLLCSELTERV